MVVFDIVIFVLELDFVECMLKFDGSLLENFGRVMWFNGIESIDGVFWEWMVIEVFLVLFVVKFVCVVCSDLFDIVM